MLDVLEAYPEATPNEKREKERLRFLVYILYFLGLRIHELETHTWGAFKKTENQWWFWVLGKGDKLGKIPVNDELLKAMIYYRKFLNLSPLPDLNENTPIIPSFRDEKEKKGLTARQMNKILKKLALETAKKFHHQPHKAAKLRKFSAHWLRHLSASMQDRAGISFKHIRNNLRHENDETTRKYVHILNEDQYNEIQNLKLRLIIDLDK